MPWQPRSKAVSASSWAAARVGAKTRISLGPKFSEMKATACSRILAFERERISARRATNNYILSGPCRCYLFLGQAGKDGQISCFSVHIKIAHSTKFLE